MTLCLLTGLLQVGAVAAGDVEYSGERSEKIVFDGVTTTAILNNLTIDDPKGESIFDGAVSAIDICNGADVTLILAGENVLQGDTNKPVIWVEAGSTLTIEGSGSLEVYGDATASNGAAGIGGGYNENAFGDIIINGGTVIVHGVGGGAGIGGGYMIGSGTQTGNITINGGFVQAFGGEIGASTGAGLGSGENANFNGTITINGGVVYAVGGDSGTVSIGAGGRGIGDPSNHGFFSTGVNGNAVIVAPNGIGANQGFADWDAIFCSYNSDETTAAVESDGTVILNDNNATIEVWGDPILDYDLTVASATTLSIKANDRTKQPVSLTMDAGSTLTNNGEIELSGTNSSSDTSYLILKGDVDQTRGSGTLDVAAPAAVQLPLTEELVTITPASPQTYTGKVQSPDVTVRLELWGYEQDFTENVDYTLAKPVDPIKNAGTYSFQLEAAHSGNLLSGEVELSYEIKPADLTVTMPQSWTVWRDSLPDGLPFAPSLSSSIGPEYIQREIGNYGTVTWYVDEDCTEPLTDVNIPTGPDTTVYWTYTHQSQNFENNQSGSMVLHISDTEPPMVTIVGGGEEGKTYGDAPFYLTAEMTEKDGITEVPIESDVTWSSSNEAVATVTSNTNGTAEVTITGKGQATITATIASHTGGDGTTVYPSVTGTFVLNVAPKIIAVDETGLILNEKAAEGGSYTWAYNGKKSVTVFGQNYASDALVASDEGKVFLGGSAILDSANVGTRTATVTYTLTGERAPHYTLIPASSTKTVNITKAAMPADASASGTLTITNDLAKTYLFNLRNLTLDLPDGQSLGGAVSYAVSSSIDFTGGQSAYENCITAAILGGTNLKVQVEKVTGTIGPVCKIPVTVISLNFEPFDAYIALVAEKGETGHSTGDITVTNEVTGTGANLNDTFTYTLKLERLPIAGGSASVFTAPVVYRGTGTVTGGISGVVTPDENGVISFTLKGNESLVFSGNLDQDHGIEYTVTQTENHGYTTAITHQTHEDPNPQTPIATSEVTGQLICAHNNNDSDSTEWADIHYTNTKYAGISTITYQANGGSGTSQVLQYTTGTQVTVQPNSWFTRSDHYFTGWNTAADGSGTAYASGQQIAALDSSLVLYAQWSYTGGSGGDHDDDDNYTLYYHSNFGSDKRFYQTQSTSAMKVRDYGDMKLLPDRDGYEFLCWNTEKDGSGRDYDSGDTYRVSGTSSHLYAQWVKTAVTPDDTGVSRWLNTHDHMAYLSGYTDGNFGPDDNMTRAQVAQMFYRLLLEKDVPVTVQFSDVPADAWYATAVNTLASLGIVNGIGNNQFAPERQITRAEFTVIAMRFGKLDTSGSNIFTDVKADDWFYDQVVGAIKYGWIGGYADGTFRPNNTITRAEVTTIVNRMLGRAADTDFVAAHADELRKFADVPASYWAYEQIMEATNTHEYRSSSGGEKWTGLVN